VKRKIRYLIYTKEELKKEAWSGMESEPLLLWSKD